MKRYPEGLTAISSNSTIQAKRSRTYGPLSYDKLLEEDLSRAKRAREDHDEWIAEPAIILGKPTITTIKVASLCPVLKKRFIHPGGE